MDEQRARGLLDAERRRVESLLRDTAEAGREDRQSANERTGDVADRVEGLLGEEADDAVAAQLRDRLAAIERAEKRLDDGTYGRSVRSGEPIPDERLEADPAAETTVDEARSG